ncbi:MAG: hypothetical protein ACE5R4_18450 [Armatimonadota bacterium]
MPRGDQTGAAGDGRPRDTVAIVLAIVLSGMAVVNALLLFVVLPGVAALFAEIGLETWGLAAAFYGAAREGPLWVAYALPLTAGLVLAAWLLTRCKWKWSRATMVVLLVLQPLLWAALGWSYWITLHARFGVVSDM